MVQVETNEMTFPLETKASTV